MAIAGAIEAQSRGDTGNDGGGVESEVVTNNVTNVPTIIGQQQPLLLRKLIQVKNQYLLAKLSFNSLV